MNAPTIPMSIVTMMPPGSFPGMSALAIAPAIKPSTIQAIIPIASPPMRVRRATLSNATDVPATRQIRAVSLDCERVEL